MKICFYSLREYDELEYCEQFKKEFGIDFVYTPDYPDENNVSLAKGCEAACMTPCDMSKHMLDAFAQAGVKYILCRSIGYDHVDLNRAKELGMKVSNVGYDPEGVSNYAIMLMLMCLRRFAYISERAKLQDYSLKGKIGRDLSNCTVGILGTGRIGSTVAKHLSGFGCRLLGYDKYENDSLKNILTYTDMDTLFAESDVLTLHMSASPDNHHIICRESIKKMKDNVVIINTARGKLIDSQALTQGLKNGKIGAAGLDVLENENGLYYYNLMGKIVDNDELAVLKTMPNVILSPHTAFYTYGNVSQMVRGCFEALDDFSKGINTRQVLGD